MSNPTILSVSDTKLFEEIASDCGSTVAHVYTTDCFVLESYPANNEELLALGKEMTTNKGYSWQQGVDCVDTTDCEEEFHCIYLEKTRTDGSHIYIAIDRQGEVELSATYNQM